MTFREVAYVFAVLLVGLVIVRMALRRSVKRPKGGRFFKRNFDE